MRYTVLAADFDGTLAHDSRVADATLQSIKELRKSGRKTVMVTGRIVPSLKQAFPHLDLFDLVVAENGAVIYEPAGDNVIPLVPPPPETFSQTLSKKGVKPLEIGHVIVATWEPHEQTVMSTIHDLGLELQVIFNKGAVMVLPSGVNKASGLKAALQRLELSPRNAVAVGDAENDHAMMQLCELSAAVANALPSVREQADIDLKGDHGAGVSELIAHLLENDCEDIVPQPRDGPVLLGKANDQTLQLPPYMNGTLLIAGESGGGKSTVTTGLLERLVAHGYQLCIVDPEGDYDAASFAVSIGDPKRVPTLDEIEALLRKPDQSVAINLLGLPFDSRADFFAELTGRITAMRANLGRPHWTIMEEAHHLAPRERDVHFSLPSHNVIAVTVNPDTLAERFLKTIQAVIALSDSAGDILRKVAPDAKLSAPKLERGQAILWRQAQPEKTTRFEIAPPTETLQRHRRKYAMGDLAPEKSFYFRGKDGKLNLRAQNLRIFAQLAEGVDEETWSYHMHNGDVERWFKEMIGDKELAEAAREASSADGSESRRRLIEAINQRYTASA